VGTGYAAAGLEESTGQPWRGGSGWAERGAVCPTGRPLPSGAGKCSAAGRAYRPAAVKRVEIPKGRWQTRPLGIPTVKDRMVQMSVKRVIEPLFDGQFLASRYGFRLGRGGKDALRALDWLLKAGYTHVVDADLQSDFDTLTHDRLMARVARRGPAGPSAWRGVRDRSGTCPRSGSPGASGSRTGSRPASGRLRRRWPRPTARRHWR
jgi:hypothetical protein